MKHRRFIVTGTDGREITIKGDPNMPAETRDALIQVVEAAARAIERGQAFDLDEVKLAELLARPDRLDWRYVRDPEGEWAAYFHPNWEADRTSIVLADGEDPSPNEIACIELLQYALPRLPLLLHRTARLRGALQGLLDQVAESLDDEDLNAAIRRARAELEASQR